MCVCVWHFNVTSEIQRQAALQHVGFISTQATLALIISVILPLIKVFASV